MNVKIIRLKNGEDIIGDVITDESNMITVFDPMCFVIDNSREHVKLLLDHWLPFQAIKSNQITFPSNEIFGTMDPTDEFFDYYIAAIDKMYSVLDAQEKVSNMSDLEILESIIAMQEMDKETIH